MPEVEICGTKQDVDNFENGYSGDYSPTFGKILDYCEKYMKTHK